MKTKRILLLSLLAALALAAFLGRQTVAKAPAAGPSIQLRIFSFDPAAGEPQLAAVLRQPPAGDAPATTLLQFDGPVRAEWKAAVEAAGARLYGYVPDYAFIARMDGTSKRTVERLPFVRWVGAYHPAYRLHPDLLDVRAAAASPAGDRLAVQTLPDVDFAPLRQVIHDWGGIIEGEAKNSLYGYLDVRLPPGHLFDLAGLDGVLWIERRHEQRLLNDRGGGGVMRGYEVQRALGLYGAGQIVAVSDSGMDLGSASDIHPDFAGKIVNAYCLGRTNPCDWSDPHGHGTHVAGSILGSGVASGAKPAQHQYEGSGAGVAPEAQLVFQSFLVEGGGLAIPTDAGDLLRQAYGDGARIHNDSWGGETGDTPETKFGGYDAEAQEYDTAMWEHPDLLALVAASNDGADADGNGVIDPDSLGSPGTAKNVLTVGASENNRPDIPPLFRNVWADFGFNFNPLASDPTADNPNGMAAFSSRGPTDDLRIKPDVAAPGTRIISARTRHPQATINEPVGDLYRLSDGTSMATPLTSGAAAVVREWLVKMRQIAQPSAALIKAVLINGAASMAPGQYAPHPEVPTFRPNIISGWGRVDLVESVMPEEGRKVWLQDDSQGLNTGAERSYRLAVGPAGQTLSPTRPDHSPPSHVLSSSPALAPNGTNLLQNGDFEGSIAWELVDWSYTGDRSHSGTRAAVSTPGVDGYVYQTITVPANATSATFSYYWLNENGDVGFDSLYASIYSEDFAEIIASSPEHAAASASWTAESRDLSGSVLAAIKGQTVNIVFEIVQDGVAPDAIFYVDDAAFMVETGGGGSTPTPTPTATPVGSTPTPTATPPIPGGSGGPLRVTLAWTDYPGELGAARALVNDLDLEVTAPGGARYVGNAGVYDGGQCLRSGQWDACNNVEGVILPDAPYGVYTITVRGANVPQGPQRFALAASGDDLRPAGSGGPSLDAPPTFMPMLLK